LSLGLKLLSNSKSVGEIRVKSFRWRNQKAGTDVRYTVVLLQLQFNYNFLIEKYNTVLGCNVCLCRSDLWSVDGEACLHLSEQRHSSRKSW